MVGGKGRGWLCDDVTPGSSGVSPSGKRRLIRDGGFATWISNPWGGGCYTVRSPWDEAVVWTGAPPLPARVVPQSVLVRVSVVLVEETPGGSTGELPSSLPGEVCSVLAGAAPPASEKDDMNDVVAVAPAEAACLVEAGIPFPAEPVGTQSLTVRDGTLSPTDPAGILFPVDLAEPTTLGVVGLADAGILFLAITEGILFPPDPAGILFPAVSEGILFLPDPAGMPFPADLAEPITVGVTSLADAGILFPAVSEGILFPPDPAGMPLPADLAEPVTVGVMGSAGMPFPADLAEPVTIGVIGLANAGMLFPAVSEGILFPPDSAGMLFSADLAESVTVGVADLADAGILFPAVSEGIPFPTDLGKLLSPAVHRGCDRLG